MAETYLQLAQKIEELQQRAATVKEQEMAQVIERIRLAIRAYGLTVEQLFGGVKSRVVSSRATAKRAGGKASGAKFRDGSGNVWSGRGPRPRWLKAALAEGNAMDDFAVSPAESASTSASASESPPRRGARKARPVAKYKDESGNSWSGRGPKPGWFKAALAAGKTPDQLKA